MLNWYRRWKNNRYREIFVYWDGSETVRADPLVLWRGLRNDKDFDAEAHLQAIREDDEDALRITIAAVRSVFKVKSLEDGGLTEGECLSLLGLFRMYIDEVKKNTSPPPISRESTEPQSSETAITKPFSDCSSTSNEPNSVEPAVC